MPSQAFLSQVFAQVAKEYLGPASSSSSVSARNIFSGIRNLQRRSFYQNSFKDLPSDPKSQASTAAHSPMLKVCFAKEPVKCVDGLLVVQLDPDASYATPSQEIYLEQSSPFAGKLLEGLEQKRRL